MKLKKKKIQKNFPILLVHRIFWFNIFFNGEICHIYLHNKVSCMYFLEIMCYKIAIFMFLRVSTGENSIKIKFQNYFLLLFTFIGSLEARFQIYLSAVFLLVANSACSSQLLSCFLAAEICGHLKNLFNFTFRFCFRCRRFFFLIENWY